MKLEKRMQYIDIIRRNTEKLARLADDILDVTRIESNTLNLNIEQFNLCDLILDIVEEFKKNIQFIYKGLTINNDIVDTPLCANGDKVRLSQVMFILLENAAKFTKKGSNH